MRFHRLAVLSFFSLFLTAYADTVYVTDDGGGHVYSFNPLNPVLSSPIVTIPTGEAFFITLSPSGNTAYVTDGFGNGGNVYSFSTGSPVSPTAPSVSIPPHLSTTGIAISPSGTTGYVLNGGTNEVYSFNTTNLSLTGPLITLPLSRSGAAWGIALSPNTTTAYVTYGPADGRVFTFNTASPVSPTAAVVSIPTNASDGIVISPDGTTAYVTDGFNGNVYSFNTSSFVISGPLFNIPGSNLEGITISEDGKTLYVSDDNSGNVYSFNTATQTLSNPLVTLPDGEALGLSYYYSPPPPPPPPSPSPSPSPAKPVISMSGLTGNSLTLANYLNSAASETAVWDVLSSLNGSALEDALISLSPVRNALPLFAGQSNQFSFSRIVDHRMRESRFRSDSTAKNGTLAARFEESELLADAKDSVRMNPRDPCDCREKHLSAWLGAFGEYGHEKGQNQTPAFSTGAGGFVAALDYTGMGGSLGGGGFAYAYTHLNVNGDAGSATLNQELAVVYAMYHPSFFYAELGLWAGLFQIQNERNIAFPGFQATASSSPNGWTVSPFFEMGYDWSRGCFGIEPFIQLDWPNSWENSYGEEGGGPFNMTEASHHSSMLRSEVGVWFHQAFPCNWGRFIVYEKGSFVNQAPFDTGTVTAFLVGSPSSFTVETLTSSQNLGAFELELAFDPDRKKYPFVTLSYQGEFGVMYQSHQGMLTVGKDF